MKRKAQKKPKEIPRFRITIAKLFQNLAYFCLIIGIAVLLSLITYAIITYWPKSPAEPSIDNSSSQADFGTMGWIGLMLRLSTGSMIFIEVIIGVLAILLIIWGLRMIIRTARRLIWRLADEIMKPLALVEPIFLLVVWALIIMGIWLLVDDKFFWFLSCVSLILLGLGLLSFLAMRKLAGSDLDFSRAELVLGRRWRV
jgi:hypothetical protein